jgi:HlyD family secretion protein
MLRRMLLAVAIVAAIALAVWWSTRPDPVSVAAGKVDRGRVERSVANTRAGTVTACRRAKLAPQAGGQIAALPVRAGDRVRQGQVLLELWNEDSVAQTRMAQEQARSSVLRAEQTCESAAAGQREADRARQLHRDGLMPFDQLDRATSSAKTLRSACDGARADVQQGEARLAAARATQTRTVLRAPFAGVVAKVSAEVGEFTTPSPPGIPMPPAVDLIDDSCVYVTAPIDEVDVAHVRVGQPANITIDAMPGRRFPGRVRRIAPYVVDVEKQARTVDVEVDFTNPVEAKALLVGYSADAEVILEVRENALRIPTQALLEGNRVLVLQDGSLHERNVKTGVSNWQFTEVVSGLKEGDRVVVSIDRKGVVAGAKAVAE